ncbi:NAD(P)/FAD-dependent oxidoreductase [Clostridium sp. DL1XJH146]
MDSFNLDSNLKEILLIGGGHVHVHVIKELKEYIKKGYNITLISDGRFQYYSGMAASYLENIYELEEIVFDLQEICRGYSVKFIQKEVEKIDSINKKVWLNDGTFENYSILSINMGSTIAFKDMANKYENVVTVKPLSNLSSIKAAIEKLHSEEKIVILGGGAAGVEIACALRVNLNQLHKNIDITIVDGNNSILKGFNDKAKKIATKRILELGIKTELNSRVKDIQKNNIVLDNGQTVQYNLLIIASGAKASNVFMNSDFSCDKKGYPWIESTLQTKTDNHIFAVGDCASFQEYTHVKKIGVYAIKEAPILEENIKRILGSKTLVEYLPQNKYLLIVSLGDKKALLIYDKVSFYGRIPWAIKNYIDKSFMKKK